MTTANITFNPVETTNFPGTFAVQSDGFVQGEMQDDPVARFALRSGIVSSSIAQPLWGGLGIIASLPGSSLADQLGAVIALATTSALNGFTVFNQGAAMVQTPQSRVPLAGPNMAINYFAIGSGARIALPCTSTVAGALANAQAGVALYWDTSALQITNSSNGNTIQLPSTVQLTHVNAGNSKVVSYSSGTGFANWDNSGSVAVVRI